MQCNSPVQRLRVGAPPAELLELDVSVVEVFPHFTLTGRRSLDSAERRRRSKSDRLEMLLLLYQRHFMRFDLNTRPN